MGRKPNPEGKMPTINVSLRRVYRAEVVTLDRDERRDSLSQTAALLIRIGLSLSRLMKEPLAETLNLLEGIDVEKADPDLVRNLLRKTLGGLPRRASDAVGDGEGPAGEVADRRGDTEPAAPLRGRARRRR